MKREVYLWVLLFVAIVLVALCFRYFYQLPINIELSMSNTAANSILYPYQKVILPILIYNNGGSNIKNMSIGIIINNNLTTLYKITLPAGKQTTVSFNYTPNAPGTYNITAIADPSKLYDIIDREKSLSNIVLFVETPENATPYKLLQAKNLTSLQTINLGRGGYLVNVYINNEYNISDFAIVSNKAINKLLSPILNLTSYYITNITVSNAKYANNSSACSMWIRGYISPSIISIAANASGLYSNNISTTFGNMTFVKVSNKTTLCSWYSGGWLKVFAYVGNATCYQAINSSKTGAISGIAQNNFYKRLLLKNSSILSNYTETNGNVNYAAILSLLNSSSFIYAKIANNTPTNNTCYGIIDKVNNTYYCSSYILPISKQITGLSLIRTTAYVNTYNLTVISLSNTTRVLEQVPININTIENFNISGRSLAFVSGLINTCSFNESFPCSDVTFRNGTIAFRIINNMSKSVRLNSLRCYTYGSSNSTSLNTTLNAGNGISITAPCYSYGGEITGVALNLHLNLLLNYSVLNKTQTLVGSAHILFG
jgi:hypothetical protein